MPKLPTLKPRLPMAPTRLPSMTTRENRMTGRALQARRLRIWTRNPRCACCDRLTVFPHGFELDHIVPLFQGGQDTDENTQVMCVEWLADGTKAGCHVEKSSKEMKA